MEKFCVFCGGVPAEKTDEHIEPLWLLKATGAPNRRARFGPYMGDIDDNPSQYCRPFTSYHFPACKVCNETFAKLESSAKYSINKALNNSHILNDDIIVILDWLDKLRTGEWLAYYYLSGNYFNVKPKFYISSRIGSADRGFAIYNAKCCKNKLVLVGTKTPIFALQPSCMGVIINNKMIITYSS